MRSACFLGLALLSFAAVPLCLVVSLRLLPDMSADATRSALVIDSQTKFDASPMSDVINITETYTFFNLTNAYELQTQSPAPKPIFREVAVELVHVTQHYDYASEDDGAAMSYKTWSYYTPVNPADLSLVRARRRTRWRGSRGPSHGQPELPAQ